MIDLPRLGYGAANIGNLYRPLDDAQSWSILEAAWAAGIRYFDTAPHYGLGLSEERLGRFLSTKPRGEFVVSTKVGRLLRDVDNAQRALDTANGFSVFADRERIWDFSRDGIRRSLDESITRLGLDDVDVVFLHDPEEYALDHADTVGYPALVELRDEGVVGAVGVGSKSIEALERAARTPGLDLLMVAGRLTLAEQPAFDRVVPSALDNGAAVVAAGVFNSGLLSTDSPGVGSCYEYGSVPDAVLDRVRAISAICGDFGVALPTVALHYPLQVDPVRSIVVGGSRVRQVEENAARLSVPVPEGLWARLREERLIP